MIQNPLLDANDGRALKEQQDAAFEENDDLALKMQGDAAFKKKYYADALALYTKVYSCIIYFISSDVHFTCR